MKLMFAMEKKHIQMSEKLEREVGYVAQGVAENRNRIDQLEAESQLQYEFFSQNISELRMKQDLEPLPGYENVSNEQISETGKLMSNRKQMRDRREAAPIIHTANDILSGKGIDLDTKKCNTLINIPEKGKLYKSSNGLEPSEEKRRGLKRVRDKSSRLTNDEISQTRKESDFWAKKKKKTKERDNIYRDMFKSRLEEPESVGASLFSDLKLGNDVNQYTEEPTVGATLLKELNLSEQTSESGRYEGEIDPAEAIEAQENETHNVRQIIYDLTAEI